MSRNIFALALVMIVVAVCGVVAFSFAADISPEDGRIVNIMTLVTVVAIPTLATLYKVDKTSSQVDEQVTKIDELKEHLTTEQPKDNENG